MSIVSEHVRNLIAKQVDDNGLVVWYDPDGAYSEAVEALDLPGTTVLRYQGSFILLRWEIDQRKLMDGEEPPRLVVYVPMHQEKTHHALIELEAAGVVMQPGQQPPARNTRLSVVARNALKGILNEENLAEVVEQTEAGKLTLADLDALADKGGEISRGIIALIFSTGNSQEVALSFLASSRFDESITKKEATGKLLELLSQEFGFDAHNGTDVTHLRRLFARHVLMTELISCLGDAKPPRLASVPIARTPATTEACKVLANKWRSHREMQPSYVAAAERVEQEFGLATLDLDPKAIEKLQTFAAIERALLRYAETRLLEETNTSAAQTDASSEVLRLAESRMDGFWCHVDGRLQAHWALVASAAQVLLQADRVEQALKRPPTSVSQMIREYTEGPEPWCMLDTHHRHMEKRWYDFEADGDDHDSLERLIMRARQRYTHVASEVARQFLRQLQKTTPEGTILRQRETFEKHARPWLGKEKIAYIWVDALRFEMAKELAPILMEYSEVDLLASLAAVPTITEIGMAALLPNAHTSAKVVSAGSDKLALEINGKVIKDRRDRVAFLKEHVDVSVFDTRLDKLLPKPSKKVREGIRGAQLVLVTSQEIDELCESDNVAQARRQMDRILKDLKRCIRILSDLGVERIVLAADHGHLFAEELTEDMKIDAPGGQTVDLHRRAWVGHGGSADDAVFRMPIKALGMESEFDIATPWTLACFRCKGGATTYFHGGLSPQELIVPVMVLTPLAKSPAAKLSSIEWKLIPGSQKLSTRFFSVQITGEVHELFDIPLPHVRVELRARGKTISRTVSASYGFEEATGDVTLRYDEVNTKQIAPNTVTLMVTEEPVQKTVSLHLLDAATGVELSRIEKIDVAISM